ncbi:hypothetical protein AJ80_00079 [Polytolypa hystricis UAMH7299]|uniref:Xaa-Pro aminopeptidase n=1 Tax=Polytolypa hystricis (strain UAMH7299) TaxID=1447883 RepID=A0A2B7Z4L1_POLH7|nr:hypothetical protein AJ80_00079 [Polytolypa hystricis UAMH7299]
MTAIRDNTTSSPEVLLEACDIDQDTDYTIVLRIDYDSMNKYPAKQHARRVAAQFNVTGGLIYLTGQQTRLLEDSDQSRPFRQRRYFFYLSGVDEADCHLTYDIRRDKLILFVPNFDVRRAIWMGPTLRPEDALSRYDVDGVEYFEALDQYLAHWSQNNPDPLIYVLHESQKPPAVFAVGLEPQYDSSKLLPAMDACRVIKDDHEIGLIKRANEVTTAAHTAVLQNVSRMQNEAEIHGTFLQTCVSQGAHSQAYEIIAASGENAATLHYTKNNELLKGRQLVCLDAGAEWNCYACDVTRTFPLSCQWPSEEAREIYEIVQLMQEECISRIKQGVRFRDLHLLAHDIAIEQLLRLGILRGTVDELRPTGVSMVFFPHGLGHHLGLEVHDVSPESINALQNNKEGLQGENAVEACMEFLTEMSPCTQSAPTLKAGMVLTVEPGIYFSRLALKEAKRGFWKDLIDMDVVERYIPVGGVRIEDDILVTKDGYENLTTAPKGAAMLEVIRQAAGV